MEGTFDKKYIIIGVGLLLVLVLLILVLVSGRNKKDTSTTEATKLVIWDSVNTEADFKSAITDFNRNNPKVEIEFVKKNPATYETDSINAIASGEGPDVWIIPSSWMAKEKNKLASLAEKTLDSEGKKTNDQFFKETFVDAAYTDAVHEGQVYGLPLSMDTLSLYYNSELLGKIFYDYAKNHQEADLETMQKILSNPPATWDDLITIIKTHGANTIALGSSSIENSSDILTALLLQYGAQLTANDNSSALFHTATNLIGTTAYPGAQALGFYTSFAQKGSPNYTWDANQGSGYNAFVTKKVIMMIGYGHLYNQITKDLGSQPSQAALPQISKTKQPTDIANYQMMTAPKNGPNSKIAWEFISSALKNPFFLNDYLSANHLASPYKQENQSTYDFSQRQAIEAKSWHNPDPAKVDAIFRKAIDQNLSGGNAQTVIEGAAAQISTLLSSLKGSQ